MAIGKEGNVKWVDGLRGIASSLVVLTHIARAFDGILFASTTDENSPPRFLQLPFLRVLVQGRIGVTIFAFVTGYVCALKPIKLYRQGNHEAAFSSIAKSALRRTPRLVLPAAIATAIVWFFCELGVFEIAKHCDSWWTASTSPDRLPFFESIRNLFYQIILTWTRGKNSYDGNQWTLLPLLRGSMYVYIYIIATSYVIPEFRMLLSLGMWLYWFCCSDSAFGMQFFFGVFLCDLQNHPGATAMLSARPKMSKVMAFVLLFLGLYIASYPEGHFEWMTWSRQLHDIMEKILPANPDFPRFSSGIGLEIIVLGLHFSPWLRDLLSNRLFLWLGRQSFAVYLLHGPILRTTLAYMLYGISVPPDTTNDKGETVRGTLHYPGHVRLLFCLVLWLPLNYIVAVGWTTYVDPWCAKVTERFVNKLLPAKEEKTTNTPLPA